MPGPDPLDGGFADPVFNAQGAFRAVMDAMSRPGTIFAFAATTRPPPPLSPIAAAVALTLCDQDTPVWFGAGLRESTAALNWLAFHTGAPLANTPADAHFALIVDPASAIALENFAQGTQEYPDRSTTLILQVASFDGGVPLVLEGPGIETVSTVAPSPMPRHFAEQWKQNRARFPRGIDLILTAPGGVVCLPRTTRIGLNGA